MLCFASVGAIPIYVAGVRVRSRSFSSWGNSNVSTNVRIASFVIFSPRVKSFNRSYGLGMPCLRITVCTASANTSQALSRSAAIFSSVDDTFAQTAQCGDYGKIAVCDPDADAA